MAHKETNIFGTSFLDLLSGALAAVIILFVIVPKMSSQQQEALEEIQSLNMQVGEIAELLEQNRNSIPQEVYDELICRFEELLNTVSSLTSTVENLQQQLANAQSENRQLRQQLQESQTENQTLQQRIEELEQRLDEENNNNDISSGELFGLDGVELAVVITWTGLSPDVDLYIKDLTTDSVCYYRNKETSFGQLREDITTHKEGDDKYELFFQKKLKPGKYEILVADYEGSSAYVNGYVVLHPGRRDQQRIEMPPRELREIHVKVRVGILTVTETSITIQ